jgi:glutathione S-transferase
MGRASARITSACAAALSLLGAAPAAASTLLDPLGGLALIDPLHAVFDAVDAALSDGRPFLCGDQISAADVTFAALAGPLLLPAAYPTPLPRLDQLPAAAQEALAGWADRPAGVYGLRVWAGRRVG